MSIRLLLTPTINMVRRLQIACKSTPNSAPTNLTSKTLDDSSDITAMNTTKSELVSGEVVTSP